MKKLKLIVSTLASFLLAGAMSVSLVACAPEAPAPEASAPEESTTPNPTPTPNIPPKTDEDVGIESNEDTLALQKITLEGNYPTEFDLNAPYSSDNLSVSATYIDITVEVTEEDPNANVKTVDLNTSDYTIDYSEYDPSKVGTYTIYVSHTHAGVTRFASYDVSVNEKEPEIGGIVASAVEEKSAYTLTADVTSVTVGKDAVKVYRIGSDGKPGETPLADADYNVQLYLGSEKCQDNSAGENGVYCLEVSLASDPAVKDFVLISVANPVSKIELAQSGDAVYTQEASSKDTISGTWQFTVTYANGKTKTVKSGDAGLTIEIDTATASAKKAAVSYAETPAGASAPTTVTCEVDYTITAKPVTGDQTYTVTHDVTDISSNTDFENVAAAWIVTWAEDKEDTSEGVVIDYADNLKGKSGSKKTIDESKSVNGSVTFDSSNTITITVKDNVTVESLVLWISHGSDGTRTATFFGGTIEPVSVAVTKDNTAPLDKIEVSNLGKGEYTLTADQEMRIYEIDMTYTVKGTAAAATTYTFDFAELQAALKERVSKITPNTNPNNNSSPYIENGELGDKIQLEASDFEGEKNGFITFLTEGTSKSTQYRTAGGGCIEIKGDRLQVTLTHAGTITIAFSSTGGSSDSELGLKNSSGAYMEAEAGATAGSVAGMYKVTGTSYVEITFTVEAGTYTITTGTDKNDRAARINKLVVVDGTNSGGEQSDLSPVGFNFNSITNYDSSGNVDTTVAFSETIDVDASYVNSITIKNRTSQNFGFRQEEGTIEGTDYSYTQYLFTRGASQQSRRVVELNLSTDYNYIISVYASVDNDTNTGRYVGMQQNATVPTGNGTDLTQAPNAPELTATISQTDITIDTANGGIVYIGGTASIRIYYIVITPVAKV